MFDSKVTGKKTSYQNKIFLIDVLWQNMQRVLDYMFFVFSNSAIEAKLYISVVEGICEIWVGEIQGVETEIGRIS